MNRRRVGLAALVLGAGAAVRHRLKSNVSAEPEHGLATTQPDSQVAPDRASFEQAGAPPSDQVGIANDVGDTTTSDLVGATENVESAGVEPASSAGQLADAAADATSSRDLLAAPSLPSVESVSLGDPQVSAPALVAPGSDADTSIKLPSMPPAGSRFEPPAVVIPSAAGAREPKPTRIVQTPIEPKPVAHENTEASAAQIAATQQAPAAQPLVADTGNVDMTMPELDVPAAPAGAFAAKEPFYRAHRGWSIAGGILLGLVVVAVIAASVIRLPYYSLQPGSVYDTIERVEAPGDLVSIPNGEIGFVTVSQTANISPFQWLDAKLDQNVTIRHEDEIRGDQTADELREADVRRMQVSKSSAVVVALQKLGFDLIITPLGIEVAQVFDCTAADGTLGTGDLIVGVNGVEVRTGEELVEQLLGQTVGAEVELLIERIDPTNPTQSLATDLVAITLGSADAPCLPDEVRADEPRPFIGIGTLPIFEEELPIEVDVRTGSVSGPSAGLAFTLAIMDVLSEGELTNGLNVVATGTIDRDGNVGPVGGIHQKTIAAERAGADVFIVPICCDNFVSSDTGEPLDIPSNYEEALLYADDIIIIGVDTLDEALIALGELGGDVDAFVDQTTS